MEIQDTYFLDSSTAHRVAEEQNSIGNEYITQICYYDGEKITSNLSNLIHLPMENLVESLVNSPFRLPTTVNFEGFDFSDDVQAQILEGFLQAIVQVKLLRQNIFAESTKNYYSNELDFTEPLRFFLMGNIKTQVMQYVSQNIASTLKNLNYEVLYLSMCGIEDDEAFLKQFYNFNPHVTININHLNNQHLKEDLFNFVWFQDPMPILLSDDRVNLRERDFIFSLLNVLDDLLIKKNIPFQRQSFCINNQIFHENKEITKEKKIVFIGSSYASSVNNNTNTQALVEEATLLYREGVTFSKSIVQDLSMKHNVNQTFITTRVIPFVIRDQAVLDLCSLSTTYKIEIYGAGWNIYDTVRPYYKGILQYGDEIAKIYNSATFVFAPHQNYIIQQRTLEGAGCGAIPILYDCREVSDEKTYEESICYFKTKEDLEKILANPLSLKKDLSSLVQDNTYNNFVEKILMEIKNSLEK